MRVFGTVLGFLLTLAAPVLHAQTQVIDRDSQGKLVRLTETVDSDLVWQVDYGPHTGVPSKETLFHDGTVVETAALVFDHGVLQSREVANSVGEVLYTDRLAYWPDGSLRRVERKGPSGIMGQVAWTYGDSLRPVYRWSSGDDGPGTSRDWTQGIQATSERGFDEQGEIWNRVTTWLNAGKREVSHDIRTQTTIERNFDVQGHLLFESVVDGTTTEVLRSWAYDATGRIVRQTSQEHGLTEEWQTSYLGDALVTTRLTRSGLPVREETRKNGELVQTKYYDRGKVAVVEIWQDGRLVSRTLGTDVKKNGETP